MVCSRVLLVLYFLFRFSPLTIPYSRPQKQSRPWNWSPPPRGNYPNLSSHSTSSVYSDTNSNTNTNTPPSPFTIFLFVRFSIKSLSPWIGSFYTVFISSQSFLFFPTFTIYKSFILLSYTINICPHTLYYFYSILYCESWYQTENLKTLNDSISCELFSPFMQIQLVWLYFDVHS